MENLKTCETLTKLDARGIKKALMEFADFDIEIRNEIFKIQRTNFHKLKEKHKDCDNETLTQSSLVISIREYIKAIPLTEWQMEKHKKTFRKKRNKEMILLERWAIIKEAILVRKMSFRELTEYLYDKYDLKINHSYVNKIWNKIEGEL